MATLLQLKNYMARYIGENDSTSLDDAATDLLDDSYKELCSLHAFGCNKTTAEIEVSSGVGDFPSDIDYSHIGKIKVYKYSGNTKHNYIRVDTDELDAYTSADYVYAVDRANRQIQLTADATVEIDYYATPDDLDDDTDEIDFPVPKAISRMAAGQYWLSFEEDEDQAKYNFQFADSLIEKAIKQDKLAVPYRLSRPYGGRKLGFNK